MDISHNPGFGPSGVVVCTFFTIASFACAGVYSGGTGTAEDPYTISTVADWQELIATSTDWGSSFILTADLDFAGAAITPVAPDTIPNNYGFQGIPFTGTFNGRGHELRNIVIHLPDSEYVGVFGLIGGAVIENIRIIDVQITGGFCVGGLAGFQSYGSLSSCYVDGSVIGKTRVGGLVGSNAHASMNNCRANGSARGTSYAIGGLAGEILDSSITGCHASGTVNGLTEVGGLLGINDMESSVISCSASGSVNGTGYAIGGLVGWNASVITACIANGSATGIKQVGGLVGYNDGDTTITSCYATGSVYGDSEIGGLVGRYDGEIRHSYSVGAVSGNSYFGGLCGRHGGGSVSDSFWDMVVSGQTTSAGGVGKTTAEMKTLGTFTDAGWDFVFSDGDAPVWKMGPDGYPALFWEFCYSGGNGTAADPYKISTVTDWQELIATSADWDKNFILINDIDFAGANLTPVAPDTDTAEWNWFQGNPFSGVLEGNGFVFHNGVINLPEKDYVGLFGYVVSPGRINNFGIENFSVVGRNNTGGLCGANGQGSTPGGEIADCYVIASVEGGNAQYYLGGLCGTNRGTISGCYSTGTVTVGERSSQIGGLCGWNDGGIIRSCYSIGTIIGASNSYEVGGLCGWTRDGMIQTSYASEVISGYSYSGGLCALNENTPIMACFWNRDLAEFVISDGGRALTTEQMKTLSIFQNAGWSGNGWVMADGQDFPRLAWENTGAPLIPVPGPVPLAGNGTESDPYQIHTAEEFAMLNWHGSVLDKHIQLMNDLDFTGIDLYPIGDQWNPFSGVFYGNGHILRNMVFNEPGINYIGLFGCLNASAIVQNLGVENMTLTGRYHVGGLCGENRGIVRDCSANGLIAETQLSVIGGLCGENSGTLSRCYVSGSLLGRHRVGGLCGKNAGLINDCQATGAIQGNSYTGGLCGQNTGILSGCNSSSEVRGWWDDTYIGGLCGMNGDEEQSGGIIVDCYSAGSIACDGGAYFIGGLCGSNPGIIMDCFATSSIRCWMHNYFVGGLTGGNGGTIRRCYAAGSVRGYGDSNDFGGLCGGNGGTINGCYASGSVTVGDFSEEIGGLIGANNGMISDCFCFGPVIGDKSSEQVGGLCGINRKSISQCYTYSSVSVGDSSEDIGGFCGLNIDTITASFWDTETSGQTNSSGGEGKTTAEMRTLSTFTDAGWDFVYSDGNPPVWKMGPDGYPVLFWEFRYSGGSGTAEDPYKISTVADWQELIDTSADWDKHFVLTNDIDFGGANLTPVAWHAGPIGDEDEFEGTPFTGVLDGNGYVLRNAVINKPENDYVGLFACLGSGSQIRNLGLDNIAVAGRYYVGSLCGGTGYRWVPGGTISHCYATGEVNGQDTTGGLCGSNGGGWPLAGGRISHCYATGSVIGGDCVGGLCGRNDGEISASYATGSVSGTEDDMGGLCGVNSGTIRSCYATGPVSGYHSGGLVGLNGVWGISGTTITSCYATGEIHGSTSGGLCGFNQMSTISDCYATGSVNGHLNAGGLCGFNLEGVIRNNFWDVETSGQTGSDGGTGKTTAEMKTHSTFTGAGWDFVGESANGMEDVWRMCEDGVSYPRLSWEFARGGDFACPDGVALEDLLYLAERWTASTPETVGAADADGNGRVDLQELSVLSQHWLEDRGPITLKVYSDGWGTLMTTYTVAEEGSYKLKISDTNPYYQPSRYFIYASREGYYTEQYLCTAFKAWGDYWITVDVDLDPVAAATFNGTIFLTQYFFASWPLDTIKVTVKQEDATLLEFQTDAQGRFSAELAPGSYVFEFIVPDDPTPYVEPIVIGGAYQDIGIPNHAIAFKPNIYLYPETELVLRVGISFPHGGQVLASVPEYRGEWAITAAPSGLIDGEYDYLFYESSQGDRCQYQRGWVVGRDGLADFFRENLDATGFNEREISDFLSYWIPRLKDFGVYAIYPQYDEELARMNELHFSVRPDSIVRLWYAIRGLETGDFALPTPEIPRIDQRGFAVREWGVMLK